MSATQYASKSGTHFICQVKALLCVCSWYILAVPVKLEALVACVAPDQASCMHRGEASVSMHTEIPAKIR